MTQIPRMALILGLAGLLPFFWGLLTLVSPGLNDWGLGVLGPRFVGPYVQLFYGAVILSFMSGVLWGFAARAEGRTASIGYLLSVIPALWAFFTTGGGEGAAAMNLSFGFAGLLLLDTAFWRWGLAPKWWMHLRILLTVPVVACLLLTSLL